MMKTLKALCLLLRDSFGESSLRLNKRYSNRIPTHGTATKNTPNPTEIDTELAAQQALQHWTRPHTIRFFTVPISRMKTVFHACSSSSNKSPRFQPIRSWLTRTLIPVSYTRAARAMCARKTLRKRTRAPSKKDWPPVIHTQRLQDLAIGYAISHPLDGPSGMPDAAHRCRLRFKSAVAEGTWVLTYWSCYSCGAYQHRKLQLIPFAMTYASQVRSV